MKTKAVITRREILAAAAAISSLVWSFHWAQPEGFPKMTVTTGSRVFSCDVSSSQSSAEATLRDRVA